MSKAMETTMQRRNAPTMVKSHCCISTLVYASPIGSRTCPPVFEMFAAAAAAPAAAVLVPHKPMRPRRSVRFFTLLERCRTELPLERVTGGHFNVARRRR